MKRLVHLLLTLLAFALLAMFTAPVLAQKGGTSLKPWKVPPDSLHFPVPTLDRRQVNGLPVWSYTLPDIPFFEATLVVRSLASSNPSSGSPADAAHDVAPDFSHASSSSSAVLPLILAAALRNGGTQAHSGPAFATYLAQSGLALEVSIEPDFITLTVRSTADDIARALELLAALMTSPAYPPDLVDYALRDMRAFMTERSRDALALATDRLYAQLFGAHPYAAQWELSALNALSRETLMAHHRLQFCPNRAMLAVTSPLDGETLESMVAPAFEAWTACETGASLEAPSLEAPSPVETGVRLDAPFPGQDTAMVIGRVLDPLEPNQLTLARVLARVLDHAIRSRVETDRAGAALTQYAKAALLWAWAEHDQSPAADVVWQEVARARRGELTKAEINAAIREEIASTVASLEDSTALAREAVFEEMRGHDNLEAQHHLERLWTLNARMVRLAGKNLLGIGSLVEVVCGPGDADVAPETHVNPTGE